MINRSILYLPPKDVDFFGREAELQWLDTCWQTGVHLAAIVDEHNLGKTSLVTKWLANIRDAGWPEVEHRYFWSFCGQGPTLGTSSDWFFTEALEAMAAQEHLENARAIIEATGYHRRDEEVRQLETVLRKP